MGIVDLLGGTASTRDEEPDENRYWCTECGMTFERSCPGIDYSWCTRCGSDGVRKLSWPTAE